MRKIILIVIVLCGMGFSQTIEPPLEISGLSIKDAMGAVFSKAKGVQYVMDIKDADLEGLGKVYFNVTKKMELDEVLKLILDVKGLTFEFENGKYHIKGPAGASHGSKLVVVAGVQVQGQQVQQKNTVHVQLGGVEAKTKKAEIPYTTYRFEFPDRITAEMIEEMKNYIKSILPKEAKTFFFNNIGVNIYSDDKKVLEKFDAYLGKKMIKYIKTPSKEEIKPKTK